MTPSHPCDGWAPNAGPEHGGGPGHARAGQVGLVAGRASQVARATLASLSQALLGVLDLAGLPHCAGCGQSGTDPICATCLLSCPLIPGPPCLRCGAPWRSDDGPDCGRCRRFGRDFAFERAAAHWWYRGTVPLLVHAFKFGGRADLLHGLGQRMARGPVLGAWLAAAREGLVVPVPARRKARALRGYDQAVLLAQGLAHASGRRCVPAALLRRREPAGPQAGGHVADRRRGPRAGFRARPEWVSGRQVLLVDDVLSSGATADAASRALLCAGARSVTVLVLAS